MADGGVLAGDVEIAAGHSHIGVAEEFLQRESIAAVAEVVDGEGVPKSMGVAVFDARLFAQPGEHEAQAPGAKVQAVADGIECLAVVGAGPGTVWIII